MGAGAVPGAKTECADSLLRGRSSWAANGVDRREGRCRCCRRAPLLRVRREELRGGEAERRSGAERVPFRYEVRAAMGAEMEQPGEVAGSAGGRVYLDHNATTPLAPEVAQAVDEAARRAWGNPSSSHPAGKAEGRRLGRARGRGRWSCRAVSRRQEGQGAHRERPGEPGEAGGGPARGHHLHLGGHGGEGIWW